MVLKKRILLVIAGLPAGGAERQMSLLARGLDRDKYDVGLLIFGRESKIHYTEIFDNQLWFKALNLNARHSRLRLAVQMVRGIRDAATEFQPDLIHASLNVANHMVRFAKALRQIKAPVITSIRNDYDTGYRLPEKLAEQLLCRYSNIIISNAHSTTAQIKHALRLPEDRLATIENGIDPKFGEANTNSLAEDLPLGLFGSGPVALSIGRFTDQKNHLGLLDALASLDAKGQLGDWQFVIVGEGPLENEIKQRASLFAGRVQVRPPVKNPIPLYLNSTLVIIPSHYEGLTNVALEAQAIGCPVAISIEGNAAGAVKSENGWILENDMVDGLAELFRSEKFKIKEKGNRAKRDIFIRFSAERMISGTEEIYIHCLEKITNNVPKTN